MPLLVATSTAVSPESRLALARGAAEAGTVVGTGGGIVGREQGAAGAYLLQLQPGVPVRDADLLRADAVELSISADPRGRPGFRDATDHANVVLTTPVGHAPSVDGIPDYATELLACVEALRDRTGGAPIGLRIAAGSLDTDVATAAGLGIDFLTVTAGKGVGLPVLAAIVQARRLLAAFPRVQLVVAGGLRTPDEIVKALALGADAITLGSAALMAMGCQRYRACDQGTCPVGIATQQAELRLRFNADISAHLLATFLTGTSDGIAAACRLAGRRSIADLRPDDLVALTPDAATITGLPYLG
jgi:glutamate synthase domain-containing protein 2